MFISNHFFSRQTVLISLMLVSPLVFSATDSSAGQAQREQAAQKVAQQFMKQLGGHLKKEMKSNGPVAAIKVCKDVAPEIANELSLENGWRVTRVTTKTRNSMLGTPDLWERETLAAFEARAEKGESYSAMKQSEIVDEAGKSYYRFMKPLAVQPVCLKCHGSNEQIPEKVQAELNKQYPFDQARNYKIGDLRGAISIKQPMDTPLKKKF
ncbi:MAG: DUF3365 domain-containing protein [Gammaproteobacteria bacterium]|nr:MAG: DUF3365 domain-containing protein [Gammaproteobacteria bacterium]